MISIKKYLVILLSLFSLNYSANLAASGKNLCKATPSVEVMVEPREFANYNDLSKEPGEFENEFFNKILIKGNIRDLNCVPIADAKIQLWQADEYNNIRYIKQFASDSENFQQNKAQYSEFIGNAEATTNNLGQFHALTVIPASKVAGAKNKIAFRVAHKNFPSLTNYINLQQIKPIGKGKNIYVVNITLDGKSRLKRY